MKRQKWSVEQEKSLQEFYSGVNRILNKYRNETEKVYEDLVLFGSGKMRVDVNGIKHISIYPKNRSKLWRIWERLRQFFRKGI